MRVKYGIYWDDEARPHCPACETPLTAYAVYNNGTAYGFNCVKCDKIVSLWSEGPEIKSITIEEARQGLGIGAKT